MKSELYFNCFLSKHKKELFEEAQTKHKGIKLEFSGIATNWNQCFTFDVFPCETEAALIFWYNIGKDTLGIQKRIAL